jgi:hypothetical protein
MDSLHEIKDVTLSTYSDISAPQALDPPRIFISIFNAPYS